MRWLPAVVRSTDTGREEPGLAEAFVPTLPNGRTRGMPSFRPLHLIALTAERETVLGWLHQHRPDLLLRSHRHWASGGRGRRADPPMPAFRGR